MQVSRAHDSRAFLPVISARAIRARASNASMQVILSLPAVHTAELANARLLSRGVHRRILITKPGCNQVVTGCVTARSEQTLKGVQHAVSQDLFEQ